MTDYVKQLEERNALLTNKCEELSIKLNESELNKARNILVTTFYLSNGANFHTIDELYFRRYQAEFTNTPVLNIGLMSTENDIICMIMYYLKKFRRIQNIDISYRKYTTNNEIREICWGLEFQKRGRKWILLRKFLRGIHKNSLRVLFDWKDLLK